MPIYLDYNASTPVDPRVLRHMLPYLGELYGNPSSTHSFGRQLKQALEESRLSLAQLLQCQPDEIFFTSGASESNNTVLKGAAFSLQGKGNHIITTGMEHPSVLNACRFLEKQGVRVTYLPVDRTGLLDPGEVRKALTPQTILISVMHANNELGTIQPLSEISAIARSAGVLLHSDAAQSIGKIRVTTDETGVDLLSIAGHKFYAPKGIGALFVRKGVSLEPLIHGAGQESGFRSGTQNAAFIAAIGKAAELARLESDKEHLLSLRNRFRDALKERLGDRVVINGHPEKFLPNTLHVSFRNITGVDLLDSVPEVAASTGAACHSGQVYLSDTLKAVQIDPDLAPGSVRFSIGRFSTAEEIDTAAGLISRNVPRG